MENLPVSFFRGQHRIIENKNRIIIFGKAGETQKILNIAGEKLQNYKESKFKFIRNFKATWFLNVAVKIKDENNDNDYVKVNIGSLAKHLGISRSEIRKFIKADETFKEILQKISREKLTIPSPNDAHLGEERGNFTIEEERDILMGDLEKSKESDKETEQIVEQIVDPVDKMTKEGDESEQIKETSLNTQPDIKELTEFPEKIEQIVEQNVDPVHEMTKEENKSEQIIEPSLNTQPNIKELKEYPEKIEQIVEQNVDLVHGMTKNEIEKIEEFCTQNQMKYSEENKLTRIGKEKSTLPRTLHYVPVGTQGFEEGWYINLGTKGGLEFSGEGGKNRVTHILSLKNKKLFVKRSGKIKNEDRTEIEIECNKALMGKSEHIAAGIPYEYRGTVFDRETIKIIKKCIPKGEVRTMALQLIKGKIKMEKKEREEWVNKNVIDNEEVKNSIKKNYSNREREEVAYRYIKRKLLGTEKKETVSKVEYLMDNISGGDLFDHIYNSEADFKFLGKEKILIFSKGITEGLKVMHKEGWIHCDLKPANILLDGDTAKITDFDLAVQNKAKIELRGTSGYTAPEMLNSRFIIANEKIDIWSHGCVLAELAYGKKWKEEAPEFEKFGYDDPTYLERMKKELFPNYQNNKHLDYVIFKCLSLDPAQRPTAEEVSKMLDEVENVGEL